MFSVLIKDTPARAKIVRRGHVPFLLAAFQLSAPPLVWQADLEKMANTTIALREKEGSWELGYTPLGQGAFVTVASFDERHEAEKAYAVVQRAMGHSSGPIAAGKGFGFLRFLVWLIVLAMLLFVGASLFGEKAETVSSVASSAGQGSLQEMGNQAVGLQAPASQQEPSPKELRTGVPANADDVLPNVP